LASRSCCNKSASRPAPRLPRVQLQKSYNPQRRTARRRLIRALPVAKSSQDFAPNKYPIGAPLSQRSQSPSPQSANRSKVCEVSSALSSLRRPNHKLLPLNLVPQISSGIPHRLVRLHVTFFIGRAQRDRIFSRRLWRPCKIPSPKRIRSKVFAQLRRFPCLQIVFGNLDFRHPPISAECNSAQRHAHPRRNFSASIR